MSFIFVCWHTNQLSWAVNHLPPPSPSDRFPKSPKWSTENISCGPFHFPPTAVSAPTKSWFFDRHLCNGHSTSKVEESRPNVIIKGETILIRNRSVRRRFHLFNPHLIVHYKDHPQSPTIEILPSSSPFITIITITTITFIISIIIRIMPIDRVGACAAIFAYRLECGWPRVGGTGIIIIIIVIIVILIMVEGINPNRQNHKL